MGLDREMAERGRDRVRDVRPEANRRSADEPRDHDLDLFLFGAPVSRDRFLDRRRRVFEHAHAHGSERGEHGAAGMGELKRRSRARAVEGRLDGRLERTMGVDDREHVVVQPGQTAREIDSLGQPNLSARDELGLARGAREHGPTGASGARVDPQDRSRDGQEAASEMASASKERLA